MFHFFRKRLHESVAVSAYLAAALTMQIGWMANWLVYRSPWVQEQFTLNTSVGPISGLYLKTTVVYILLFGLFVLFFRGKDLSHWRERVLWFFLISVLMFFVLTLPVVYEFTLSV